MSVTSLTDRYVWSVSRQLPAQTGPDVAQELRGTLAETIEGRVAAGEDPVEAERAAVAELGDPDVLAREYGGRPSHLIGSSFYPDWVRLVRFLLAVVLPVVVAVAVGAQVLSGGTGFGALVGEAVVVALHTAVHLVFWSTLLFAVVERYGDRTERDQLVSGWDPESLADPDALWRRVGFRDVAGEIGFGVAVTLLVVWQFAGVGERGVQVLDPDLALGWQAGVVALLVVDVLFTGLAWLVGRWTVWLSMASAVLNVALAVLLVGLVLEGRLLTDLPRTLGEQFGWDADWSVSTPAVVLGIVVVCVWDAVTALLRARRGLRGEAYLGHAQ